MPSIKKDIVVDVPVKAAYDQWTQFESFPQFMDGVKEVVQLDEKTLRWRASIGGKEQEWESEITEQVPDDLPVTTVLKHGHAGEEIVNQIETGEHDLIVMGSRGLGRVTSNLFGSVGGHVHFHTHIPMLIVHPQE